MCARARNRPECPPIYPYQPPTYTELTLCASSLNLTSLFPLLPLMNILMGFWGTAGGGAGASASPISETATPQIALFWKAVRQNETGRNHGTSQSRGDVMLSVAHQKLTGKEGSAQCVTLGADWRGKPALPQLRLSALLSADSRLNFYFLASFERILLC